MSSAAIIAIAIAVVVVLGAIAFVTLARRTDVRGAGALSGETRKRDHAARRARADAESLAANRPTRSPAAPVSSGRRSRPGPWTPPDPEAIGVSRRQFFNRATVTLMSAGIGAFAAAGFVAFLWPPATAASAGRCRRQARRHHRRHRRAARASSTAPEARTWITEYPADALPKAEAVYPPAISPGCETASSCCTRSARTSAAACRSASSSRGSSARATARSTTRSVRRRRGPAPRGMDRFAVSVDAGGTSPIDTGTVITGPPIGTNTTGQEAEGPHCITGAANTDDPDGRLRHDRHRVRSSSRSSSSAAGSSTPLFNQRGGAQGARLGDRARAPTASRTTTTRCSRASASSACSSSACCCSWSSSSACRCTGCSSRPARPGPRRGSTTPSPGGARSCSRPTADGGFNCAGCHGGMKATGGAAPYTVTDPATGEVTRGQLDAPALNTVLYRFSPRTRCAYILTYGRPSRRCRRGASPAADR